VALNASELALILQELSGVLSTGVVQKVYAPAERQLYLETRIPGRSVLLSLSADAASGRLAVSRSRPASPLQASAFQQRLRALIVGARLEEAVTDLGYGVALRLKKGEDVFWLVADWDPRVPHLALLDDTLAVLGASPPSGRKVAHVRGPRGQLEAFAPRFEPDPAAEYPWASAAEQFLGVEESTARVEEARREQLAALKRQKDKLKRTMAKVEAEANRGPKALEHQRLGNLISQNLHVLKRGSPTVRVTEYSEEGVRELEIPLSPQRTPREEVEWHFHQYRRLSRGAQLAAERLKTLQAELSALETARVQTLEASELEIPKAPRPSGPSQPAPLYREFQGWQGTRILVGKHGRGNDELTLHVARPHDLWVHVRGQTGSHVIVRLERQQEIPQEVLLDAAHLAVHFSSAKGEDRVEVQYAPARFIRRVKGGAPGQVLVTREKTFVLRLEPERLRRLLASVENSH